MSNPTLPAGRWDISATSAEAQSLTDDSEVSVAGRLMLYRRFGRLTFGTLQDRQGRIQIALQRDVLGDDYPIASKSVRVGDYVGVRGVMMTTDKGERTVSVRHISLLNRPVRPLPDKWQGVNDPELRARRRYLDLLVNPHSRERLASRARIIEEVRSALREQDFLEVETPILQAAASGAAARPFQTHHNALGEDLYLRISPETYLKRLVAGGLDRVFELGRNFRNEGMDSSHLPEFTMVEWYAAYWDYRDNMAVVQQLFQRILDRVFSTQTVEFGGTTLDFSGDWPVLDYRDLVFKATGIDLREVRDLEALRAQCSQLGDAVDLSAPSYAALVDQLYKKTVRPELIQPCFLVGHPAEMVPLARRSDDDPTRLDMFQVVANGWELVKGYSELVDPEEQRRRLEEQATLREQGDEETMMLEEDFLEAMEYGMPPMSGVGMGIDRLAALLTDAATLRDVVYFPAIRPDHG